MSHTKKINQLKDYYQKILKFIKDKPYELNKENVYIPIKIYKFRDKNGIPIHIVYKAPYTLSIWYHNKIDLAFSFGRPSSLMDFSLRYKFDKNHNNEKYLVLYEESEPFVTRAYKSYYIYKDYH